MSPQRCLYMTGVCCLGGRGFMEPVPLSLQNLSVAEGPNYLTACAGPPSRPQRPFCAVCGFPSPYTCVSCGARYCTVRCLGTHQETRLSGNTLQSHPLPPKPHGFPDPLPCWASYACRCLKWTV